MAPLAVGGWLLSGIGAVTILIGWRSRSTRREAVARVCHELRGPLTAARLGLQLGARKGELTPARLGAIELELARAALALEDLRSAGSRFSASRACEEIEVGELLLATVEAWRASAADTGVALRLGPTAGATRMLGDRLRLAQALGNLIANAIEHGGEAVEVRARGEKAGVRLEVIDDGPGLPAPVAELVRRARGGRGARGRGLAIAAAVAKAHGGRLAAAPSERGARLVLELPARLGVAPASPVPGDRAES